MPPAKPLSKLERVPLREAWKHEAGDFTPWLAEAATYPEASIDDEIRWDEGPGWLLQRLVNRAPVLRPVVKGVL
jgi:hypothetical protein